MPGIEDAPALRLPAGDLLKKQALGVDIQTDAGLVQQQIFRAAQVGADQTQPLLHSAGELARPFPPCPIQGKEGIFGKGRPAQPGKKPEILFYIQVGKHRCLLRGVAQLPLPYYFPGPGAQGTGGQGQSGGFADAVGTGQNRAGPGLGGEAHVLQNHPGAISKGHVLKGNHTCLLLGYRLMSTAVAAMPIMAPGRGCSVSPGSQQGTSSFCSNTNWGYNPARS